MALSAKELEEFQRENERAERVCFAPGENRLLRRKVHWLGAVIGGNRVLPHQSRMPSPVEGLPEPDWPDLHPAVASGRYMGDEWAHDPALDGWVYADAPGRLAVQCADALRAAKQFGWLAISDRRIAVVLDQGKADQERQADQQPQDEEPEEPQSGGLFGKAKALAGAFSGDQRKPAEESATEARGVRLWECALPHVGSFSPLLFGRTLQQEQFLRIEFRDRSALDIRTYQVAEIAQNGNRALGLVR